MKNSEHWTSTKYEFKKGKLRGSRNPKFLTISSRLMTDITAAFYQHYLPLHVTGNLVDLGCGNVPFYQLYKPLATTITCVDWPNSYHKNQFIDVECDLNKELPLARESFDTIIISEVLEHISNPELTWSEMSRILKPNGKIILSVPFLYRIHEAPHDYYRYTKFALHNFADKNNLKVMELKSFGGLPEVLTDIAAKNVTRFPLVGSALASFLQRICSFYISTRHGKKVSEKTGENFPLGYFMIAQKN